MTVVQMKHILLFLSIILYTIAFLEEANKIVLSSSVQSLSSQYFDYYSFAKSQKNSLNMEIISLFMMTLYSLKFFQIFQKANLVFFAFKKSAKEFFFLMIIILILYLGLSLVSYYIYSQFLNDFQHFSKSILMNFNIFILSTNLETTFLLSKYFKNYSIIIIFFFIFILRYFLFNLFYPIYIENYRMESENFLSSQDENEMTLHESTSIIILRILDVYLSFQKKEIYYQIMNCSIRYNNNINNKYLKNFIFNLYLLYTID
jgi:hypothetical protein